MGTKYMNALCGFDVLARQNAEVMARQDADAIAMSHKYIHQIPYRLIVGCHFRFSSLYLGSVSSESLGTSPSFFKRK